MNCSEVEARLIDVVDGRLDPVVTVRLHAHIEGCADCRTRAAFWRVAVPRLRGLAPDAPDAMSVRRMQVEIERLVAAEAAAPAPPAVRRWPRLFVPATLAFVGAAAVLLALRAPSKPLAPGPGAPASEASQGGYATLTRVTGTLTIGGRAQAAAARLPPDRELVLAIATQAELSLDRGSTLRIDGPARLRLGGTARAVEVRLDAGTLDAAVAHRLAGETFTVATPDLRVEVRGTRFAVVATSAGSSVRVREGRVAVRFADGSERPVAAGESASWPMPAATPPPEAPASSGPVASPSATERPPGCGAVVHACEEAGRAARRSMRSGDAARALRLIAAGSHDARDPDASCASSLIACEDELRYLRAEAFRQEGALDEAVAAYHQLDRHGAPAAMRQNALYAAAQIEERQGHEAQAHGDYERALGAAPEGALREEALFGSMESAAALGDTTRARQLARRYLATYPSGLRVGTARRLAGPGAQP